MSELEAALKALIPDKSPGEDGITNRMLRSGGPNFRLILHEVFNTLWEYEIQPSAWERSLLQPIFKNGGKDPADPASYRGIYLSSALAKLFEGILIFRLTQFTEAHNTLTENQLGTRPGRQVHDAIYILLSIIQHNYIKKGLPTYVVFLDYSTPGSLLRFACVLICAFGAFGAGTVALTSPRKHFTRQVESLSGPRIN
jgi:hypothetical protein